MPETDAHRRKRLYMRSIRRGIKEMDLILTAYADARLAGMDEAALTLYDALLNESDHDLYQWVTGQVAPDARYAEMVADIQQQMAAG
jgi:antitoxin CptB